VAVGDRDTVEGDERRHMGSPMMMPSPASMLSGAAAVEHGGLPHPSFQS
jgi:hypothetical protein